MYKLLMIEDDAVEADVLREHARRYAEERGEEFSVTWYRSALELTGGEQPFDLIFETPAAAPEALQVRAIGAALDSILAEYRQFIAYGLNL